MPEVYDLAKVTAADVALVGGKAASLGELLQGGFRVPKGFVVAAGAKSLSPGLIQQIDAIFGKLGLARVAVRSSGISEDGKKQSWAGQFATFLHVDRAGLFKAIQACWDSAKAERVAAYGQAAALAVLVQEMVDAETSGVAFSINPVTGNKDEIMIEAVYGLCEPLVQGLATPDNYVVAKDAGTLISQAIASKPTMLTYQNGATTGVAVGLDTQNQPAVSNKQLVEIASLVRRIEQHYGFPVDIEWSYQDDQLYLLQARPITTI